MIDKKQFSRLREDPSQLQKFGDAIIDEINSGNSTRDTQMCLAIAKTFLKNINGRDITVNNILGFDVAAIFKLYRAGQYTVYPYINIVRADYNEETQKYEYTQLTKEQASKYLEFMTGSAFLPEYNADKPQNSCLLYGSYDYSYIVNGTEDPDIDIQSAVYAGTFWKPEYKEGALNLWYITNPYLTIGSKLNAYNIDSTNVEAGQVLTADGEGHTVFTPAPSGGTKTIVGSSNETYDITGAKAFMIMASRYMGQKAYASAYYPTNSVGGVYPDGRLTYQGSTTLLSWAVSSNGSTLSFTISDVLDSGTVYTLILFY